jgi:hypothetical protein
MPVPDQTTERFRLSASPLRSLRVVRTAADGELVEGTNDRYAYGGLGPRRFKNTAWALHVRSFRFGRPLRFDWRSGFAISVVKN